MARGINKVIIVGNLGRDPETRYLPSGGAVTNVSVATSKAWRDRESGEQKERTEWHRVVFFNRLAEIASEYLKRGSKIYLEGELRTREWEEMVKSITQRKLLPMKCKCSTAEAAWMAAVAKGLLAQAQVKAVGKGAVNQIQVAALAPRMILARRHQMTLMMISRSSVA